MRVSRIMSMMAALLPGIAAADNALKAFKNSFAEGGRRYRRYATKRYSKFTKEDRRKSTSARKRGKKEKILRKIRSRKSLSRFKQAR